MRLRYPASFLKFLLLGFALVAVPLSVAFVGAFLSLRDLTTQSEHAIISATSITRDSRTLGEQLRGLERIARQQLVLRDPEGLEAYAARRRAFLDACGRLVQTAGISSIVADTRDIEAKEESVWELLNHTEISREDASGTIGSFAQMIVAAERITTRADAGIEANIAALREQAERARRQILLQLWILVPIGLALSGGLALWIRNPIRQIEAAIRGLGDGRFDNPIAVSGPQDLVSLGKQLDWLRIRLNEADAQKTRFLHHVSHELKTPLTALQEGTQLLCDDVTGKLNGEQEEIVKILHKNSLRLRRLIENLLDYSSIRFQRQTLNRENIELGTLFSQVADDQRLHIAARGVNLEQSPGGLYVQADREKLRVVIDNLLSNAVKYAPEGSCIEMEAREVDGFVEIEITDSGPGIPEQIAPTMFEPFVQGPAPTGKPLKGTGLGLSIVREFVTAHGGDVRLERNRPSGTKAIVRLPQQIGGSA